ncbi:MULTISPECIES: PRC-barrel domain-containing protein [unclassified Bradyrhizobium]|uniref:PRC-barrel domain-containing protein n=1 Tax=unclassified Bradyrhizobium TaxID=2631580 RepID=UPI0020B3A6BC|nr:MULTISPECIES: PRC-barrel domain-containing protein [unclassified Bradyrhizobium]MCP3401974.1 PRC-barrel domain-containing protein [Bradyrhizobium sp. CCGB20]MCP3410459.1 PRC-barrel domain-containing protein [Bradyrhizobium sp. CCGB01]
MPRAKEHAAAIMREYHKAETELIGRAVVLTDGKAGTVEGLYLDEAHGLRLSIAGHPGKWPVSTIKPVQK